ncbi:PDZ domain-containing protein [Undibacterium sp. Tian12W]|uniref:M61 family metallopeptidase n=1 Tax=Undibacterium sp. Tian12W TaxID=3413054 RepID=UPI003BF59095
MKLAIRPLVIFLSLGIVPCSAALAADAKAQTSISLNVDMRDVDKKIVHATETITVRPGKMTLAYPKWIPNEHAFAAIDQQVNLRISGNNSDVGKARQTIPWRRDALDLYSYHITVPEGVNTLEIKTDFITTPNGETAKGSASNDLAVLSWNNLLLYAYPTPDTQVADITVMPSLFLPAGWRYASSLETVSGTPAVAADSALVFKPVSLEMLVDAPVIAGKNFKEIPLAPGARQPHYLDMVADTPANMDISPQQIEQLGKMITQGGLMFGNRHYRSYRLLLSLSDQITGLAGDHHESLDSRRPARFMTDPTMRLAFGGFIPHDFVHSWNGKYRRPAGAATPNFQVPQDGGGLWVHEGLTDYLGNQLTVRAGIWTPELYLDALAETVARFDQRPGKTWRNLQDTATMAMILWNSSGSYNSLRRDGFDFYGEGGLIWLDVDMSIRNKSGGKKSLDDFNRLFFGNGGDTDAKVVPYTIPELVAALNSVVAADWQQFFDERLLSLSPNAPHGGLTQGGYRLVYRSTPNTFAALRGSNGFLYSIAAAIDGNGMVSDVLADGPAARAGLVPNMKITLVNGKNYSKNAMQEAIRQAQGTAETITVTVQDAGNSRIINLDYHDGEKFPALERVAGTTDLITEALKPLAESKNRDARG